MVTPRWLTVGGRRSGGARWRRSLVLAHGGRSPRRGEVRRGHQAGLRRAVHISCPLLEHACDVNGNYLREVLGFFIRCSISWTNDVSVPGVTDGVEGIIGASWGQAFASGRRAWHHGRVLSGLLTGYQAAGAAEAADLERMTALAASAADPWSRALPLHFTASALVVHPETQRVLLRWHNKLGRWLQVGGHGDRGEADSAADRAARGGGRDRPHRPGAVAGCRPAACGGMPRARVRGRTAARARRPPVRLRHG